jgi:hypothetical protein
VADDLRADLDELLSKRRQGPATKALRQGKPTNEVREVVRQDEQLQANLIGIEALTREPRPLDRLIASLILCSDVSRPLKNRTTRSSAIQTLVTMKPTRGKSSSSFHST